MKTLLFLLAAGIMLCGFSSAQKIKVSESAEKMSLGHNNALTAEIPEAAVKDVEKTCKKFMKDYGAKVSTSGDEVSGDNATVPSLSSNSVDIYARVTESESGSKLMMFFDLGGAYLSSSAHPDMYKTAERIVRDLAVGAAKEAVTTQLEEAQRLLKKLENEQKRLESEKQKLEDEITRCKETIQNNEKSIEENINNQEGKKKEIAGQAEKVQGVEEKLKKIE